ncbi:MAG: hypothetical protein UW10_C0012G0001 [Candidatus Magasanikbacteria bacterium GW2011_GWA2_43_9]|nr:MAG: hypothetical protein UW10_C0012G0001 [Candidatus Magasanikbacteria bacterium GW2011_GWA2_43_9]
MFDSLGIVNPDTGFLYTEPMPQLTAGREYDIRGILTDDSGNGYVHIHIEADQDATDVYDRYVGPQKDTSADPYTFIHTQPLSQGISRSWGAPKAYTVTATGSDIDHNIVLGKIHFVVIGAHCDNGVADPLYGEIDIDIGGSCGFPDDATCTEDYECASFQCVDGSCVSGPRITDVNPMNGAAGNWITVQGKYFGVDPGTVAFGSEDTEWVEATLVSCPNVIHGETWNASYAIVEVPEQADLDISNVAIRITTAEGKSDSTVDEHGPKPVYVDEAGTVFSDGLFRYTATTTPGLCAVVANGMQEDTPDESPAGPPGTHIKAVGTGFGDAQQSGDQLLFKVTSTTRVQGNIEGWSDNIVLSSVPITFSVGTGSFMTIYGKNFGVAGKAYLSKTPGAQCPSENPADGCIELYAPGEPCQNTWTDTQIVVEIGANFGQHYLTVQRADNRLKSDGIDDNVSIEDGLPRPSICSLSPAQGPAPLPNTHDGLVFQGKNFTNSPILYFWSGAKDSTDIDAVRDLTSNAWLSWGDSSSELFEVTENGTRLRSSIAYYPGAVYPTMPFGQWPITIKANGRQGNSVQYFVTDCRAQQDPPADGLQCCTEGPDTGSWKNICEGEVRTSGYVWRFTTGILPAQPHVLVQCDQGHWFDDAYDGTNPSPVPSQEWQDSENMCLNATLQVAFSMGLDDSTINEDTVRVYACGGSDQDIDCEDYPDENNVSNLDLSYQSGAEPLLLIEQSSIDGADVVLQPETWYRVILTDAIASIPQLVGGGVVSSTPLRADRPLTQYPHGNVSFYYDFQTGSGYCSLNNAFITPREKTVSQLGQLKNVWQSDIPFYYYLKGRANRVCTVLNVDDLGWDWSSDRSDKATIQISPSVRYVDTRATATALRHAPDGVVFSAQANVADTPLEGLFADDTIVAGTSTLYISLGKPKVSYYEPNCEEACPNGNITIEFSRHMDPETYADGIRVEQCSDPNCIGRVDVTGGFTIDKTDPLKVILSPKEAELFVLQADTYYKVTLDDHIKSLGRLAPREQDGESLAPHTWVFRTKQDGTLCSVNHVAITPNPFVATYIGQKTKFTATPYGAPNECSKRGQVLNTWAYPYEWSTEDEQVATVTTFGKELNVGGFCTPACLPSGSTISFLQKEAPLCGNGIIDAGEDCDILREGEVVGHSCTLSCLRPGSSALYCGGSNATIDPQHGETCDPSANIDGIGLGPYCTEECLKTGSAPTFRSNVSGYCGDGQVGLEEACDTAISLDAVAATPNISSVGCTNTCLHAGTPLSAQWCQDKEKTDDAINDGYITQAEVNSACAIAQSVCGNGEVEEGEECEVDDGTGNLPEYCSPTCLLEDVCATGFAECSPEDEGCTEQCTYAGSSLLYATPSVCGDGIVGTGEIVACEATDVSAETMGQMPLQIVSAIGNGAVEEGRQSTLVSVNMPGQTKNGIQISGNAEYTLQCGFTEYDAPENNFYNDCVFPDDGSVSENGLGVGIDSCCYMRPVRQSEYPLEGAGLENEEPVCRNTYIEVTFDIPIDPSTIVGNANIVRGYEQAQDCAAVGGEDVTDQVSVALFSPVETEIATDGLFARLWHSIKHFFQGLINSVFARDVSLENIQTWCTTDVELSTDVVTPTTTISLSISSPLGSDIEHTVYAVLLEGGKTGIKDIHGVGIKDKDSILPVDAWAFEVGKEICKIDSIQVSPSSYLFDSPNTSTVFLADAITSQGQRIAPTDAYAWAWKWEPQDTTIFNIPADDADGESPATKIGSTNVEGTLVGNIVATVTADVSPQNNHLGKTFIGSTQLTSMFCEHPWPQRAEHWLPYVDTRFNFSFSYCADDGESGTDIDDLPYLEEKNISISDTAPFTESADVLKKTLFVNQQNTDAIGIQIFSNPNRLTSAQWFAAKFPGAPPLQQVTIGGYDVVADQDNYYINAVNVQKDGNGNITNVYNNIYLFSISSGAQASTRDVYQEILTSLEFNTNITDYGYCSGRDGVTPDFEHACTTDFNCVLGLQTILLQEGQIGACAMSGESQWQFASSTVIGDLVSVTSISPNNAWIGMNPGGILKTTDGGNTWKHITPFFFDDTADHIIAASSEHLWVISTTDLYQSTDAGETWQEKNIPTNGTPSSIVFLTEAVGFITKNTTAGDIAILKTSNSGQAWNVVFQETRSEQLHDIAVVDASIAIAVGDNGLIYRTTDGGTSWQQVPSGVTHSLRAVSVYSNAVWIVGDSGIILYSDDKGATWNAQGPIEGENLKNIIATSGADAWIVGDEDVYQTQNGGTSWVLVDLPSSVQVNDFTIKNGKGWYVGDNGSLALWNNAPVSCMENADCTYGNVCQGSIPEISESYTSNGCNAEKTKLLRDWERLKDIRTLQSALQSVTSYPSLQTGTFRKHYVSSVWPSWGTFSNALGANMPQDPLNTWDGCDPADNQTCWDTQESAFICPQYASVYEYVYDEDTETYTLHVPLEFFKNESLVESLFSSASIDPTKNTPFIVDTAAFTVSRACTPGQVYTFTSPQCGDGVVGPGEQCDPPGSSAISTTGITVEAYGVCADTDLQCSSDTDCRTRITFKGAKSDGTGKKEDKTVFTGYASGFCGFASGEIFVNNVSSDPASKTYSLFSCQTDSDCLDINTYLSQADPATEGFSQYAGPDLGAFGNNFSVYQFEKLQTWFDQGVSGIGCSNFEDVLQDAQLEYAVADAQCIGAVIGGESIQCSSVPTQTFSTKVCNNDCQWNYGACESINECGNGRVEGEEKCDDGYSLNGKYGQCNLGCSGLSATYCGNGALDDTTEEFCDWSQAGIATYDLNKEQSCSWDCQTYGSYCGDGKLDDAEACDDGNREDGDGCSNICTLEGFCAYPDRQTACYQDSMCPVMDVNGIRISGSDTQQVCMYNGTDIVYRLNAGNIFTVYTCDSDAVCQNSETYQRTNFEYGYDYPEIYSGDVNTSLNFMQHYQDLLQDVTCAPITNSFLLTSHPTYTTDGTLACIPAGTQATGTQTTQQSSPSCGNGKVDTGEQCDPNEFGTKTYADCSNLNYGESCTYCTEQCRIATQDAVAYCGNGQIDEMRPGVWESCDVNALGAVFRGSSVGTNAVASCEVFPELNADKNGFTLATYGHGDVQCLNNCTNFVGQCYNCGPYNSGPTAQIAFLNPMLGTTENTSDWGANSVGKFTAFLGRETTQGEIEWFARTSFDPHAVNTFKDTTGTQNMRIRSEAACTVSECGEGQLCEGDGYRVVFNEFSLSQPRTEKTDAFVYKVNNEQDLVTNEYVVSPAIPNGFLRIVVRWDTAQLGGQELFGAIYKHDITYTASDNPEGPIDPFVPQDVFLGMICNQFNYQQIAGMGQAYTYAWPAGSVCNPIENGLWAHPLNKGIASAVQSFTIDVNAFTEKKEPMAFVVQSVGTLPIGRLTNKKIIVDVYMYHEGQVDMYSIFAPTYSFDIQSAIAGIASPNTGANYWHVLNIIPDDPNTDTDGLLASEIENAIAIPGGNGWIVPVEEMATDQCDVKNQIYATGNRTPEGETPSEDFCIS